MTEDQYNQLKAFAKEIMDIWPADVEGEDLENLALKHGLLTPEIRHEDCADENNFCMCAEYCTKSDYVSGFECLRKTDLIK